MRKNNLKQPWGSRSYTKPGAKIMTHIDADERNKASYYSHAADVKWEQLHRTMLNLYHMIDQTLRDYNQYRENMCYAYSNPQYDERFPKCLKAMYEITNVLNNYKGLLAFDIQRVADAMHEHRICAMDGTFAEQKEIYEWYEYARAHFWDKDFDPEEYKSTPKRTILTAAM